MSPGILTFLRPETVTVVADPATAFGMDFGYLFTVSITVGCMYNTMRQATYSKIGMNAPGQKKARMCCCFYAYVVC